MVKRFCNQCLNYFETNKKASHVCLECRAKNHKKRYLDNIFNVPILRN